MDSVKGVEIHNRVNYKMGWMTELAVNKKQVKGVEIHNRMNYKMGWMKLAVNNNRSVDGVKGVAEHYQRWSSCL